MNDDFATNLTYLRGEKDLTQQELGDAVGVSASQISRYEAGTAKPRKTAMRKLAQALGVTVEALHNPDMCQVVLDEPGTEDWNISIPRALKDRLQSRADEMGVSLQVMFMAELERGIRYSENLPDLGVEHHIQEAKEYLASLESNQKS